MGGGGSPAQQSQQDAHYATMQQTPAHAHLQGPGMQASGQYVLPPQQGGHWHSSSAVAGVPQAGVQWQQQQQHHQQRGPSAGYGEPPPGAWGGPGGSQQAGAYGRSAAGQRPW